MVKQKKGRNCPPGMFTCALLGLLALNLGACGDSTGTAFTGGSSPGASPSTAAATSAAAGATTASGGATTPAAAATTARSTTAAATTAGAGSTTTAAVTAAGPGSTTAAPATAAGGTAENFDPILFVHGNGDSSSLWVTTIWRFESNGYPRDRLFALDVVYPNARTEDDKPEASRTSTEEERQQLSAKIDEVLAKTGASKLVLVGQSRGGYPIRNYLAKNGTAKVSKAITAGTPNHGVSAALPANSEFNGQGPFLKSLNTGNEVPEGVPFLTLRSDKLDKFAQQAAGVDFKGPELKGAKNVVLPGTDHRETGYSPQAFAEMYKFITGKDPASTDIKPETAPVLNGFVGGFENKVPTNKGVEGVAVTVFQVNPGTGARMGDPAYKSVTKADGIWGPFTAKPDANYEFVVAAPGQPTRHFFRSPFPRSTSYLGIRLFEDPAVEGKGVIYFTRPRGYIATGRDAHLLDGKPVPGVKEGVPTDATFKVEIEGPERAVPVSLNGEKFTVRAIPGEVVYAEFTY